MAVPGGLVVGVADASVVGAVSSGAVPGRDPGVTLASALCRIECVEKF